MLKRKKKKQNYNNQSGNKKEFTIEICHRWKFTIEIYHQQKELLGFGVHHRQKDKSAHRLLTMVELSHTV